MVFGAVEARNPTDYSLVIALFRRIIQFSVFLCILLQTLIFYSRIVGRVERSETRQS